MKRTSLFLVAFNALIEDGCDYALQTLRELAKDEQKIVIGLALGNPVSMSDFFSAQPPALILHPFANVTLVRPLQLLPFHRFSRLRKLNVILNVWILRTWLALRFPRIPRVLWLFEPQYGPELIDSFRGYHSLFDCVDYWFELDEFRHDLMKVLKQVNQVVVNSQVLLTKVKPYRADAVQVPLGFATHDFTELKVDQEKTGVAQQAEPTLCFGFVGEISYRFDYPLLFSLIEAFPEALFVFAGEKINHRSRSDYKLVKQNHAKLFAYPNVQWIKKVPKENLPPLIKRFTVGLIPYAVSDAFNKYCFPMKLFEYFAEGIPVIATEIEELKRFPEFVFMGDVPTMVKRVKQLQQQGWSRTKQRQQQALAQANSWEHKVTAILQELEKEVTGNEYTNNKL